MDGGDRAGYKQISGVVASILIGPSTGSTAWVQSTDYAEFSENGWGRIIVVSSGAAFAGITAPGLRNSSKITSATTYEKNAVIECNGITAIKLSCDSTGHAVIAQAKVLL